MTVPQKVTCIETGEVYQNADEAGKAIGRSPLSVRKSANAHVPVAGKHFVYGALSSEELRAMRVRMKHEEFHELRRRRPDIPECCMPGSPVIVVGQSLCPSIGLPIMGIVEDIQVDHKHPVTVRTRDGGVYYCDPGELVGA